MKSNIILVTGSTGLVGTHFINAFKGENRIIALVHNEPSSLWVDDVLDSAGTLVVRGDVTDFELMKEVMARYEVDLVAHFAAIAKVKTAYLDPYSVYKTNIMGTVSVLEAARQVGVKKVLFLETDKVYGEKMNATEDAPYQPSEPYATSKLSAGMIAKSYIKTHGTHILIPHACNIFGFDPFSNRIVPNTVKNCIRGEPPLIYTNDKSIREYVYVEDVIYAFKCLLNWDCESGPYNVSTGWLFNQEDLVKTILKFFPDVPAKYVEAKLPPQVQEESLTSNRWSWKPRWKLEDALSETISRFKEYREDWD